MMLGVVGIAMGRERSARGRGAAKKQSSVERADVQKGCEADWGAG
jgi:hypothetical protein